jgi:hypothetical protein
VFAVPRSIAKSLENKLNKDLNAIFNKYLSLNFQIFKLILSDKEMPFREKRCAFVEKTIRARLNLQVYNDYI